MTILFEVEAGVAVITLNRPEARNAIDGATSAAVAEAIETIESDPKIRVSIITGAGGYFCAGMDLKAYLRKEVIKLPGGLAGVTEAKLGKPLIAAIEGYALAGGFEIALCCDLIVAATTAKFGLSEVKRGLVANAGGLLRLPRQLPPKIATEMLLTGDTFPASHLAAHGLINRLVPEGGALAVARELAVKIAANGPLAVAACMRVLRESGGWSTADRFARQNEITAPVFASEDAREGALAFAEKRAPVWQGR